MTRRSVDPAVTEAGWIAQLALKQVQDETLARVEASVADETARARETLPAYAPESAIAAARAAVEARRNRTGPHDDPCPNCGAQAYDNPEDPQMCGECGTRVCPVCGADFAETYAMPEQDRLTDNLGEHVRRWHEGVTL